jgi:hypothetical protein
MRIRPLPLHDALRLASTLSRYVDVKKLNPEQNALDFVDEIVQQIEAQDFVLCVKMMTKKTEYDLEKMDGLDVLALFMQGLRENRVIDLLEFYNSLGK